MRFFLLLLLFFTTAPVFAQNNLNQVEINTNTVPAFSINSIEALENGQTITNCFTVRLRSRDLPCSIFAKYALTSSPAGFIPTGNPLTITHQSTSSSVYTVLNTFPIPLTPLNQLLLTQSAHNGWQTYNYNLTYGPLGYNYLPGNYSYTITFTMTQP